MKLRELPGFSDLYLDFVENSPRTHRFLSRPDGIGAVTSRMATQRERDVARHDLALCLTNQNTLTDPGEKARRNLDAIADGEASVILVSCGPDIAGGRLSNLLKCLTAVRLCEEFAAGGAAAVTICTSAPAPRENNGSEALAILDSDSRLVTIPESHWMNARAFDSSWSERLVAGIEAALGRVLPSEIVSLIADSNPPGISPDLGCARFFSKLLATWGVLVLDPLDPEFLSIAQRHPQISEFNAQGFLPALERQQAELDRSGYHLTGSGRMNLEECSKSCLGDIALESALPVACHVVDQAEVYRFALTATLFPGIGLAAPLLWPRASATALDSRTRRLLDRHKLAFQDFFAPDGMTVDRFAGETTGDEAAASLDRLAGAIETTLKALNIPGSAGTSLASAVDDAGKRMLFQAGKLKERFNAARLARQETLERQIERVRNTIAPGGSLQEMGLSCLHFLVRYSSAFPRILLEKLDILLTEHQLLFLE